MNDETNQAETQKLTTAERWAGKLWGIVSPAEKAWVIQQALDEQHRADEELHIMQLAAISTASIQNTETTVKDRIDKDSPYCTTAYLDVCRAVDREMKQRVELEEVRKVCGDRYPDARILETVHRLRTDVHVAEMDATLAKNEWGRLFKERQMLSDELSKLSRWALECRAKIIAGGESEAAMRERVCLTLWRIHQDARAAAGPAEQQLRPTEEAPGT